MTTRTVKMTSAFKRDLKRERKTDCRIDMLLEIIVDELQINEPLDEKYRDHALTGKWKPCRECHVKPDLLLVYDYTDDETLMLVRLGSHAELKLY